MHGNPSRNRGRQSALVLGAGLAALVSSCGDRTGLLLDPVGGVQLTSTSTSTTRFPSTSTRTVSSTTTLTGTGSSGYVLLVSDVDWTSYPGAGGGTPIGPSLGPARDVCVTADNPANCPIPGAVVYGNPQTRWRASAQLPAAHWIWRADVADNLPADLQPAAFQKTFWVGPGAGGSLLVAADDEAWVYVNNVYVGNTGSATQFQLAFQAQSTPWTADLTAALKQSVPNGGYITLTVEAENGPASFGSACPAEGCNYSENPAGVIFYGKIFW
jgi:hypothetical protein